MKFRNFISSVHFLMVLVIALLIVVFSYLIARSCHYRLDLSTNKIYSLAPQTLKLLESMKNQSIHVMAFFREDDSSRRVVEDLLKEYGFHHHKFKVEFVDPDRSPQKVKQYQVDAYETLVIEVNGKIEQTRQITEEAITNSLAKINRNEAKTIYFVTGHGGPSINDTKTPLGYGVLTQKLTEANYSVKEVGILRDPPKLSELDVLVFGGPKVDLLPEEIDFITSYLKEGGHVLILMDPVDSGEGQNLRHYLLGLGVNLGENVIVDKLSKLFGADYLIPVVSDYRTHPITNGFRLTTFFPIARTVSKFEDASSDSDVVEIAWTGAGSWAERNLTNLKEGLAEFNDKEDKMGPLPLAVAVSKPKEKWKLVVIGDSDFLANRYLGLSGNRDFLLNTCAWLAGGDYLVGVRSSERQTAPLFLREVDQQFIFYVPVLGLPISFLMMGSFIFTWRRRYY